MKIIRFILGKLILIINAVTMPSPRKRTQEQQVLANKESKTLALYQYEACPFCVKVRRNIRKQNLNIITRDAKQEKYQQELISGGGKLKVPCLRIDDNNKVKWLYESNDINDYINQRFA